MAKKEKTNAFWGPYISNRQWGTVREDTSTDGNSWDSFKFQEAGKRRYYMYSGNDGLFGFCDVSGYFITKLSLWNHKDKIIKERLFGLSGTEGNHGEDVKELFYYVDGLPDHSYMKALYRYPQNEFPYEELLQRNLERNQKDPEFELTDTGIFDEDEYFDVVVEYGKDPGNEKNLVCCYTVTNHSSQSADITVLPQFWLLNARSITPNKVMESDMMMDDLSFVDKHNLQHLRQTWRNETKENKSFWDVLCRNREWMHLKCDHILSVPDKWEFPWFATWDTAFQMLPFARIDPSFTKDQLLLFLGKDYMKEDGQMPGCEWDMDLPFPPVYAWSCYHVFSRTGHTDIEFLQHCFQKLQLNFKWWLNAMQVGKGSYLFTGGFLGMDNISVVDRSFHLKQKHPLIQADATGWMAFFALSMLEIALVLSSEQGADHKYYRACDEYLEKFIFISEAINRNISNGGLWQPHDKFFYDVVETESGDRTPIALRSLVGIVPLLACLNIKMSQLQSKTNVDGDYVLCAVPKSRFLHILRHLTDEEEFLSPFGIRSLSKVYEVDPYILTVSKDMQEYLDLNESKLQVKFTPAESETAMMGGNMNFLIVEMLLKLEKFYGDGVKMIHPSSTNAALTLGEMAEDVCKRVSNIFAVNKKTNARPCHGNYEKYRLENSWRDLVLFYEYFDSETGRGCGASHQTGWTSLVLEFLHLIRHSESTNMTEKYDNYCSAFDNASDFSAD
uniref:Mannosylglycerate hydrolase MGH1-like glycoside hydrolase domain-containing protein n=1 Tax=Magallana gigas TaxID=29159 RepID=K1QJL7_MAGGI